METFSTLKTFPKESFVSCTSSIHWFFLYSCFSSCFILPFNTFFFFIEFLPFWLLTISLHVETIPLPLELVSFHIDIFYSTFKAYWYSSSTILTLIILILSWILNVKLLTYLCTFSLSVSWYLDMMFIKYKINLFILHTNNILILDSKASWISQFHSI